jgi:hypothetical protein
MIAMIINTLCIGLHRKHIWRWLKTPHGHNSSAVHGVFDDGIHICRRTNNLEYLEIFRMFVTVACFASGEMGEHYALTSTEAATASEGKVFRRYLGFRNLCLFYICQGKFNAAWEAFHAAISLTEKYHDTMLAKIDFAHLVESFYLMTGRETEFLSTLQLLGFQNGIAGLDRLFFACALSSGTW